MPTDTNIALGKTATASTSVAPYLPTKAVDGNKTAAGNRWLAYKTPGWLAVDLGKLFVISRWCVTMLPACTDAACSWPSNYVLSSFNLQTSLDGSNWTTVDTVSGNSQAVTDRTLATPVAARFARLYVNSGIAANAQAASIQELEVYGHEPSSALSNLVTSGGALAPAFASGVTSYTVQVPGGTSSITVTPTAVDSTARITVNGVAVASGQASAPITLNFGANNISVVVTPLSGTSTTYTVAATRQDSPNLSSLVVDANNGACTLSPSFTPAGTSYALILPLGATSVKVTPTAESQGATITVNGTPVTSGTSTNPISVSSGAVTITIEVTTASGTKQTYTLSSSNPSYLTTLSLKGGPSNLSLAPLFAPDTLNYTTHTSAGSVVVTTAAQSRTATVTVNNTVSTGNVTVSLSGASTAITIKVADGAASSTYTVTVAKP